MKRVLITGMSATGKTSVIESLAAQGHKAIDLDTDQYSEWVTVDPSDELTPEEGKDWMWREERVKKLLSTEDADLLFVSGCAENMGQFLTQFDHVILLSAPSQVIVDRLANRTNNDFGKQPHEVKQVLALQKTVEPLLRKVATDEINTNAALDEVVSKVLAIANA